MLSAVLGAVGDPEPIEIERKFALAAAPDFTHPTLTDAIAVDIEQIYLPSVDGDEQRVRARTLAGITTYVHAVKRDVGGGVRVEVPTPIDSSAYRLLAGLRDPATQVLRKRRWLFAVGDQRFELDHITEPVERWLVEAELVNLDDEVALPDFLPVLTEVTDDRAWRNRSIAELS